MNKEIKKLVKEAEELGFTYVRHTGSGHMLYRLEGAPELLLLASTPNGGKRSIQNARAQMQRLYRLAQEAKN